jgi:HAD superfamily hydrolase (TIGR01509 family)
MREEKVRYYLKLLNKHGKLFPGVKRIFKKYHGRYKLMIASSEWDYVVDKVTSTFGLQEYIDYRIGKEDVTKHKPNPEIYKKCLKILKMKPEECIVVEDSLFGIEAAKRAGIKVIAVAQTHPKAKLKKAGADVIISKISELKF